MKSIKLIAICGIWATALFLLSLGASQAQAVPFTIIVLPDTQVYAESFPQIFTAQTQWIVDNKAALNIVAVLHEGDITDNNNAVQWGNAVTSMSLLHGVVPYMVAPGNHDMGVNGKSRDTTLYNQHFPVGGYLNPPSADGTYQHNKLDNSYHLFQAGGKDWLVLALEFGPRDQVLTWANSVVSAFPDRQVIIVTHSYLFTDGTLMGPGDANNPKTYGIVNEPGGANDGEDMWAKLVKLHPNISFVFNGHSHGANRLVSHGDNCNTVYQMLADYQDEPNGGNGYLRIVQIDPAAQTVSVQTYSPTLDSFLTDPENQFTFTGVDYSLNNCPVPPTPAPAPPTPPAGGPLAHWKLDDGSGVIALDSAGSTNGAVNSMEETDWITGQVGGALDFAGDAADPEHVSIPFSLDYRGGSPFSYVAWVNADSFHPTSSSKNSIVGNENGSGGATLRIGAGGRANINLRDTRGWVRAISPDGIPTGSWHHLVGTYDGSFLRIYVDGALKDTTGPWTPHADKAPASVTHIGKWAKNNDRFFDGAIDDVRVYDRALTDQEVLSIFNGVD